MSDPSYAERMRDHLKGMVGPLAAEYADLQRRETELLAELESVREAKRDALVVLRRIDPETYGEGKPGRKKNGTKGHAIGPDGVRAFPNAEEDTATVREWIETHRDKLPTDFTAQRVYAGMRENGSALGKDKVRHSVGLLHDRGWLALNRLGNGGAKLYVVAGEAVSSG